MIQIIRYLSSSTLLKTSGLYTLTNVLNASIPFLMIPLLTRHLTTEDYGLVAMFTLLVSFVAPFVGLSIHGAISRKYFDEDKSNFPRYVGNCFYLLIVSTLIVGLIFIIFQTPISKLSLIPPHWLYIIVLVSFCQFVTLSLLTIWQVKVKPLMYGIFQISQTILNFSLSVYFVVTLNRGWEGRVEGQVIALVLFTIISFFVLFRKKWLVFKYNKEDIKHALSYSIPLIPHAIGSILVSMTDRLFITKMEGLEKTGVFMVAFQIGSVINLLVTSFNNAYVPWLFNKLGNATEKIKRQIVTLTYILFGGFILIPLFSYFLLPWFLSFFVGKSFVGVEDYATWLILGYCFNGMYVLVVNFIFYAQKTRYLAYITFGTSIVNVPLCYLLIRWNGAIGAAQSTAIIYFAAFVLTWVMSAKVYTMPWFTIFKKGTNDALN